MSDPIRDLIAEHQEFLDSGNHYAYFELAYTRTTGWMVWICDRPPNATSGQPEPGRVVLAKGQGETPDEACLDALDSMDAIRLKLSS